MQGHSLSPSINKEIDINSSSIDNPLDKMKSGQNGFGVIRSHDFVETSSQDPICNTSQGERDDSTEDEQNEIMENVNNELVVYDPSINDAGEIGQVPDPAQSPPPSSGRSKVYRSIGAFAVQCANCFKWRLIPEKQKYEEIREHILEVPFFCDLAREWRPEISCDDPPDITQDGSRLWAIDKPNIAIPPHGWQRLLRIRGEGGTRFADVYYVAPSGKRFRSMVEIEKYLEEHPECVRDGISISQFSFQTPKPLQKNYVVKRRPSQSTMPSHDDTAPVFHGSLEPIEANPISWVGPSRDSDMNDTPNKRKKLSKGLLMGGS